jgi:hypothetical protein
MTANSYPGSAKIYQFPARARPALDSRREEPTENLTSPNLASPDLASLRVAQAAFGSAWYHEEAVREAERAGKKN